ncbi:Homeobox protein Nkx-2.1 [Amphibalanus amphitrite]|uniref:Homeobox protein Nkx-2.1 n=1 Tax=Amphibalanus amphitrite TaxID=1232801 RepID=A0A6A4W7X6_AMPAM|nr:Homeobox protein Nkx-2.1 [Amphibalanus amphitrite]
MLVMCKLGFPLLGAPGESGEPGDADPADPNDMTLSPKPTPFSVSDILYPYDEVYRKSAALEPGLVPLAGSPVYRGTQQNMTNPYAHMHVPQLSAPAAAFQTQYCNAGDFGHYTDVRNTSAGWYSTPTDPRFASEYKDGVPWRAQSTATGYGDRLRVRHFGAHRPASQSLAG